MFSFIRSWKRNRVKKRSTPVTWYSCLDKYIPFYKRLTPSQKDRFLGDLKVFIEEKHFFGAREMKITEEVKVVIGAAAVRLTLCLGLSFYDRLTEIIVYPYDYEHPEEDGPMLGEAHHQGGAVVLSWPAVLEGFLDPECGHNTAYHEFAHILDRASGAYDGTPELHEKEHYRAWSEIMGYHFEQLENGAYPQLEAMDEYGATNEAEFFAVATETFFSRPQALNQNTPDLYQQLIRFYRYDPILNRELDDLPGAL